MREKEETNLVPVAVKTLKSTFIIIRNSFHLMIVKNDRSIRNEQIHGRGLHNAVF